MWESLISINSTMGRSDPAALMNMSTTASLLCQLKIKPLKPWLPKSHLYARSLRLPEADDEWGAITVIKWNELPWPSNLPIALVVS